MCRQDVGILRVHTRGAREFGHPAAWYNNARVRRDLGNRSYVDMIATDSRRDHFFFTTVGVDSDWFLTRELSLRGDVLRGDDSGPDDAKDAYNMSLDLTSDPYGFLFGLTRVDSGFNPDLGFVSRNGHGRRQAFRRRSIRPGRWGIRRVSFRSNNTW